MADIDVHASDVLDAITDAIGFEKIHKIGPVRIDAKKHAITCNVVADPQKQAEIPERTTVKIAKANVEVTLNRVSGPRIRFSGACPGEEANPAPPPTTGPGGPFVGGDGCWLDSTPFEWGTIGFAARQIKIRSNGGNQISQSNACLSAGHVFGRYSRAGDLISASGYPSAIQFVGALPVVAGSRSVDAALGEVTNLAQTFPGVVRSFGNVQGVDVPSAGLWIRKNSVKSGITIGLDQGEVSISVGGVLFKKVRQASSGFSCCHDSGAAVLSEDGKFVGMIFASDDSACENRPRAYYVAARIWGTSSSANRYDLEIEIQN